MSGDDRAPAWNMLYHHVKASRLGNLNAPGIAIHSSRQQVPTREIIGQPVVMTHVPSGVLRSAVPDGLIAE